VDGSIVALAIALVYNLEMKLARKSKIVAVFALRLGCVSYVKHPHGAHD
jgi:hypothetical protein